MTNLYQSGASLPSIRNAAAALPGVAMPSIGAVKQYLICALSVRRDYPLTGPTADHELTRDIPDDALRVTFRAALAWGLAQKLAWDKRREWPDAVVRRINAARAAAGEKVFDVVRVG